MWKDDDGELQKSLENIILSNLPISVDCCQTPEPHYFFYRHKADRGSAWAWCSNCKSFVHLDGINIPKKWTNLVELPLRKLTAFPILLEEKKDIVDKHFAVLHES